jgi:DNA-binding transcriptional ArsR family regulator
VTETAGPLDEVLAAMADPTRRWLLEDLAARGEATATTLADDLPISRQAVVKHLAVLSRAGLVSGRRQGREMRYVVRPEGVAETARWMAGLAADWDRRLNEIKRIAESLPGTDADPAGASSGGARELLARGNDPHPERNQRDRDDLEAGDAERDADDRKAQEHAGHQVPERQPPSEQDDPDDVAQQGPGSGTSARLDRPAERPEDIARDPE